MNVVDAFLLMTAAAYVIEVFLPKSAIWDMPKWKERIFMLSSGSLILASMLFNIQALWFGLGWIWAAAALLSYLGYTRWKVQWKEDASDAAQMTMFCWDLVIAICCFIKV